MIRQIDAEYICCNLESFIEQTNTQELFKEIYKFSIREWLNELTICKVPFATEECAIETMLGRMSGEWILTYTESGERTYIKAIRLKEEEFE